MLPATLKLFCGISHQHLRTLTGLQWLAVGTLGTEMSRFILSKTDSCLPSMPDSLQKLCLKLGINTNLNHEKIPALSSKDLFYLNQAEDTLQKAILMLQQEGWQATKDEKNGDRTANKKIPQIGNVFRTEAVIDSPPEHIYMQLFENLEHMDQWNPGISKVQILHRIGKNTLLTREVTAQLPITSISQRDFVSVRHCCQAGSALYLIGTAACSQLMPPQQGVVRAEAALSCIVLRPLEGDSRKTHFTWLLSVDLKGSIPQFLTDKALPQSQVDFISHLRRHLSSPEKS
ncbi:steroidogenic acute regulatory protein, mitochondrial-like [Hyperolius riggenbachi]|uniref:steroidogenic acute regulatory protein, mitochondrial-like n=1 Tax=Hyperolius riggenbachi TaxID=752182 RepID=UPI0035A38D0B